VGHFRGSIALCFNFPKRAVSHAVATAGLKATRGWSF
jgi:hypothetical protein